VPLATVVLTMQLSKSTQQVVVQFSDQDRFTDTPLHGATSAGW
jgi:hypothetical protein